MQRISITGTDGTGKTTIVRRLASSPPAHSGRLKAFRAPQYHEDPDLPFGALSADIDRLSVLADQQRDPLLKTAALFLSMTLYGDVERHLAESYQPDWLLGERQCLADSLTYARFYQPLIQSNLDRARLEAPVMAALGPEGWERVTRWQAVVHRRFAELAPVGFWELPMYVKAVFTAEPAALIERLRVLYHAALPDQVVVLTVSGEALERRLAAKRGEQAAPQELHEQAHVLAMFQAGLQQACGMLRAIKPDLRVHLIDASSQTIEETEKAVLSAIGLDEASVAP